MVWDFRPKVTIHLQQTGESYPCAMTETLLAGMVRLGRRGIPVGCDNGGCGVCKVRVISGEVKHIGPISRAHVNEQEQAMGCTLACRATPQTDLELMVMGSFEKPFFKGFATKQNQLSK